MKIVKAEHFHVDGGWDPWSFLKLTTDDGLIGWSEYSEARARRGLIALVREMSELLIGEDPLQRERLWHKVWELDRVEEIPLYLLGTVDIALWDLAGRAYGGPTWEVLGGARREIPAYASTTTFGSVEEYLEIADQCLQFYGGAGYIEEFHIARACSWRPFSCSSTPI